MKIDRHSDNALAIALDKGETLFHAERFLRSHVLGVRLLPPFWLRAPIGRLWNRCYWLGQLPHTPNAEPIDLIGHSPTGRFEILTLTPDTEMVVDLQHLAAFVPDPTPRPKDSPPVLRTHLRGLKNPAFALWGHPLPTVFAGPVTLILYGDRLRRQTGPDDRRFVTSQLVAFDTRADVRLVPMEPVGAYAHLLNATTFRSRLDVGPKANIVVQDFANRAQSPRLATRFLRHLFVLMLLGLLARWFI